MRAALRLLLCVGGLLLLLNGAFLAISLGTAALPAGTFAQSVATAFADGELVERDYLKDDWWRGKHQYNDCMVLQLLVNERPTIVEKALAPAFYAARPGPNICGSLRRVVAGDKVQLNGETYARYWHGYVPVAAMLLSVTDVGTARQSLRLLVVAALAALMVAAARAGGTTRTAGLSVGATGLLLWGLPLYGQGLSSAPGDALVMFGLAALIVWRRRLCHGSALALYSAGFGALVAFLEFLTGQLPTAACLLFLFTLLIRGDDGRQGWRAAFSALAAFAAGAVATVVTKQLIVAVAIAPGEVRPFVSNLALYTALGAGPLEWAATYARGIFTLFKYTPLLTYNSIPAGAALLAASAIAWSAAAWLAWRAPRAERRLFLAHLISASGIAIWVLILPKHSEMHGFMTRMLIVPFSLGWSALALQVRRPWPQR